MGKTGSRMNGKRKQAAKKPKAVAKAKRQAPRGKPATRARVVKTKPSARQAPKPKTTRSSPKPTKSKAKPRLSLVPPPQPAKRPKAAKKSKRGTPADPVTKPHAMRPEGETPPPPKRTKPLTPAEQRRAAYDSEVLAVLREEFGTDETSDSDAKIKRRLREKALGAYEVARVSALRRFRDELQSELSSGPRSGHFTSTHGLYANPEDFDHARLIRDYTRAYPTLSPEAIAGFIPLAVYFYYLR